LTTCLLNNKCTEESWFCKLAGIVNSRSDVDEVDEVDEDNFGFLLGLINTHPAGYLVLIWIRESPFEIIIVIIRLMYKSQLNKVTMGYWALHHALATKDTDTMLFPMCFGNSQLSGYRTHESDEFHLLLDLLNDLKSAGVSQNKRTIVIMSEFIRISRDPEKQIEMLDEILRTGAELRTLREWGKDLRKVSEARKTLMETLEDIKEGIGSHVRVWSNCKRSEHGRLIHHTPLLHRT